MIDKIFEWAWTNGLDIKLESKSYQVPSYGEYRINPRRDAPNYVASGKMAAEIPVITFSRGDRHLKVEATNWGNMLEMLQHQHKRIFSDLSCMPMELKK